MKRKALGFLAVAATLVLASGALAAVIDGTPGDDRLRGTMNADVIRAMGGNDFVNARRRQRSDPRGWRRRRRAGRLRQRHDLRRRRRRPDPLRRHATTSPGAARVATRCTAATAPTSCTAAPAPTWSTAATATTGSGAAPAPTRCTAAPGDDVLHALADDDDPDTLHCGPGNDTAKVREPERTTRSTGCETIVRIVTPSADEAAGESDRDADAE